MSYEKLKKVVFEKEERSWKHFKQSQYDEKDEKIINAIRSEWSKWYNLKLTLESE